MEKHRAMAAMAYIKRSSLSLLLISIVTLSLSLPAPFAVYYSVENRAATTPGGQKFNSELGADYTTQTMAASSDFIWRLLQQNNPADRRAVAHVTLLVDVWNGIAQTVPARSEVNVSDSYIEGIQGDIKRDFSGVLYHEMVHVWQNFNGAPTWVTEGTADFVRLRADLGPNSWPKRGAGGSWTEGYAVTAYFLDYCNDLRNGFVAELNKKIGGGWRDGFFVELLGKPVDQLWADYKSKYNGN